MSEHSKWCYMHCTTHRLLQTNISRVMHRCANQLHVCGSMAADLVAGSQCPLASCKPESNLRTLDSYNLQSQLRAMVVPGSCQLHKPAKASRACSVLPGYMR